jgi:hypothetical protein
MPLFNHELIVPQAERSLTELDSRCTWVRAAIYPNRQPGSHGHGLGVHLQILLEPLGQINLESQTFKRSCCTPQCATVQELSEGVMVMEIVKPRAH